MPIYVPKEIVQVPFTYIDGINDERVLMPEALADIQLTDLAVLAVSSGALIPSSDIRQISIAHGRSYEYRKNGQRNFFWYDEFGNLYGVLCLKGGNGENAEIHADATSKVGFMVYGYQDQRSLERILRVSRMCREAHMGVECIVKGCIHPDLLPYEHGLVSQAKLKEKLLERLQQAPGECAGIAEVLAIDFDKVLDTVKESLDATEFYLTPRAGQANARLFDLTRTNSKEEFDAIMDDAFTFINAEEAGKASMQEGYIPHYLHVHNDDDIRYFFSELLPVRIGRTLGKLHSLGLAHYFLHSGNISIVGTLFDLDSVRGAPLGLGDDEVSVHECIRDLTFILEGKSIIPSTGVLIQRAAIGWPSISDILTGNISRGNIPADTGLVDEFRECCLMAYIRARYIETGTLLENLEDLNQFDLLDVMDYLVERKDKSVWEYIFAQIEERTGQKFEMPHFTDVQDSFFRYYRQVIRESIAKCMTDNKGTEISFNMVKGVIINHSNEIEEDASGALGDYLANDQEFDALFKGLVSRFKPYLSENSFNALKDMYYRLLLDRIMEELDDDIVGKQLYRIAEEEFSVCIAAGAA